MFRESSSTRYKFTNNSAPSTKFLVTKRSWQSEFIWATFPKSKVTRVPDSYESGVDNSLAAWFEDTSDAVDSTKPLPSTCTSVSASTGVTGVLSPITQPFKSEVTEDADLGRFLNVHGFRWYQLLIFAFSIVSYLADVISDSYLVYTYYSQGDLYWSVLTMILIIIPSVLMTTFSLVWYFLDRKVRIDPPRTCQAWTFRLLFHGLQLAPLVRSADAVYYGIASRKPGISLTLAVQYTQLMLYEDADRAMLHLIECFTESAPQLLLQLYIILTQPNLKRKFQVTAQFISCAFSWLSLTWSLTNYQTALRSSRVEKANISGVGTCCFFIWKAGVLISRLVALSMLAAMFRSPWFLLMLFFHWLFISSWLIVRGTRFCSPYSHSVTELAFDFVLGAIYCFDIVNICEGHSRLWYLACYMFLGSENVIIGAIWWFFYPDQFKFTVKVNAINSTDITTSVWVNELPAYSLPLLVICALCFGMLMMIVYYMTAHPSGKIRFWIPVNELLNPCEPNVHVASQPVQSQTSIKQSTHV